MESAKTRSPSHPLYPDTDSSAEQAKAKAVPNHGVRGRRESSFRRWMKRLIWVVVLRVRVRFSGTSRKLECNSSLQGAVLPFMVS